MYDDRTENEYHENRNENFDEPTSMNAYVSGKIGEDILDGDLFDVHDSTVIVNYVLENAGVSLKGIFLAEKTDEEYREEVGSDMLDVYFNEWVEEEVGYAFDDSKYLAFGLVKVEMYRGDE